MAAGKSQSSIRSPACAVKLTCLPCLVYLLTLSEIPIYLDPNPSYLRSTKRVAYLNHSASLPRLDLQHATALHLGPGSHRRPRIDYSNPTPTYLEWRSADLARNTTTICSDRNTITRFLLLEQTNFERKPSLSAGTCETCSAAARLFANIVGLLVAFVDWSCRPALLVVQTRRSRAIRMPERPPETDAKKQEVEICGTGLTIARGVLIHI